MSTVNVCDRCGAPITEYKTKVSITVWTMARVFEPELQDLNRSVDLHVWCYVEHVQPAIDRALS